MSRTQGDLFDLFFGPMELPGARASDPVESHAAMDRAESEGLLYTQRARYAELVAKFPGCTASELAREAGDATNHRSARRLPEIERRGYIRRGPVRTCRVTSFQAVTWWPCAENEK